MTKAIKFDLKAARALLPQRPRSANKATSGKSLIIAGSIGMFGAAVLAATAAARVGSGYVLLMTDQKRFPSVRHPDFLLLDLKKKLSQISGVANMAIGIGPGLGKSPRAQRVLKELIAGGYSRVVIDADGLNMCAEKGWLSLPKGWVATPHEGELARLLGVTASAIRSDRRAAVQRAQKKLGCIVLLKGHHTLIATPKKIYEIQSGNPALAKAGTGDVLTGMITGFLAQGLASQEAACLAAFVHGYLADEWIAAGKDALSLMASDLVTQLPEVLFKIRQNPSTKVL